MRFVIKTKLIVVFPSREKILDDNFLLTKIIPSVLAWYRCAFHLFQKTLTGAETVIKFNNRFNSDKKIFDPIMFIG